MSHESLNGVVRRMENGRLVYYQQAATSAYWDDHWSQFSDDFYRGVREGFIWGELDHFFTKYLPKQGTIIEAGCGKAQLVIALRARGYDVVGVEWGQETVKRVNTQFPDIPVEAGDVTALPVADGTYAGYISMGVIEHRQAGPEPFLKEAFRVIAPGGIVLISVPTLNPIRALKGSLGMYRGLPENLEFYQYAFPPDEMASIMRQHGFEIIDARTYAIKKGIGDEIPGFYKLLDAGRLGRLVRRALHRSSYIQRNLGHMMMYVLRKPGPVV